MKELLNKLSKDLELISEHNLSCYVNALLKFSDDSARRESQDVGIGPTQTDPNMFDSGKWQTINNDGYLKGELLKLHNWRSEPEHKNRKDVQMNVVIYAGTSKVPIKMTNKVLAEKRAETVRKFAEEVYKEVGMTVGEADSDADVVVTVSFTGKGGQSLIEAGPEWCGKDGDCKDQCDPHDECFKKHQIIYIEYKSTGKILSGPEAKTDVKLVCINLGGKQVMVSERAAKDFGWLKFKPCEEDPDKVDGRGPITFTIKIEWLNDFFVCEIVDGNKKVVSLRSWLDSAKRGRLLAADDEVPFVGATNRMLQFVGDSQNGYSQNGNIISKKDLDRKCNDDKKTKKGSYCDKRDPLYREVEELLPVGKIEDIIVKYILKGDSFNVMLSGQSSSSVSGTREMVNFKWKPFTKFKSKSYARTAFKSLNLGKINNEDSVRAAIKKFLDGGKKLDDDIENIRVRMVHYNGDRAFMAPRCSGWDFVRWGGPCETWAPGAEHEVKDYYGGGPNKKRLTTPNGTFEFPYLPEPEDEAMRYRVLQWFMGFAGMAEDILKMHKRQEVAQGKGEDNDPAKQDRGDISLDPEMDRDQSRKSNYQTEADDGHTPSGETLDDHFIKSRAFRRNRIRKIIKSND